MVCWARDMVKDWIRDSMLGIGTGWELCYWDPRGSFVRFDSSSSLGFFVECAKCMSIAASSSSSSSSSS